MTRNKFPIDLIVQGLLIIMVSIASIISLFNLPGIGRSKEIKDNDLDGFIAEKFGGNDCDDANSNINPLAIDIPNDGVDQDCDDIYAKIKAVSDEEDIDGDNFASEIDCDDTQETIFPGANEIFDLLDNDCDGEVDENFRALLLYENFSIRSFESQNVIRNSKKLKTAGSLGEIFLYVEASVENPETQLTKFDSIYVYLDSGDDGGLIRRDKSFIHSKNSERTTRLLFNLKELPLSMLPYSEKGEPRILDFTTKLEQNGTHRLGAFVGSQRGGVLKKMILGHTGDGSIILEK